MVATALLGLGICLSGTSRASGFEVFGVHPESIGQVSARVASADDGAGAFYNPGSLALGRTNRLEVSGAVARSFLRAQGKQQPLTDPYSGAITLAMTLPLTGPLEDRLRLGLAMHGLTDTLMRLRPQRQTQPHFPYYDNRTQRFVLIPALGVRVAKGVGVGVGVNVLAGVQGAVDVREDQSRAMEAHILQEASTLMRMVAGLRWDVTDRLQLGIAYRQHFGIPLTIATTANIGGVPLFVDVTSSEAMFDPTTVVLGAHYRVSDAASLELNVGYHRWSTWKGPLLNIDTTVSALAIVSDPPDGVFRDTVSVRAAVAYKLYQSSRTAVSLYGGAGFESSLLNPSFQQGRSNYVDGAKIPLGIGFSTNVYDVLGDELRFSASLQSHLVMPYQQDKITCTSAPCAPNTVVGPDADNPSAGITNPGYPTLKASGQVMVASFGVGVTY